MERPPSRRDIPNFTVSMVSRFRGRPFTVIEVASRPESGFCGRDSSHSPAAAKGIISISFSSPVASNHQLATSEKPLSPVVQDLWMTHGMEWNLGALQVGVKGKTVLSHWHIRPITPLTHAEAQ